MLSLHPKTYKAMKEDRNNTWTDIDGNIYYVTKDEDGKARYLIRAKDGMYIYIVRHRNGYISLISEEESRKLAEEMDNEDVGEDEEFVEFGSPIFSNDDAAGEAPYIRNAKIYPEKLHLDEEKTKARFSSKFRFDGHDRDEVFFLIKPEEYLSDILICLPYGLIDKQVTGIGATHLELHCKRNSIIVTPTRTLAWNKSRDDRGKFLYVGTEKDNRVTRKDKIKTYLERPDIKYKKILVVADSLYKVINAIQEHGENVFCNYFLLVDEIDTLQSENNFRPVLSSVIDYYFKFNPYCRALLSATVKEFTHPNLQNESVTTFESIDKPKRDIHIHYTDNINSLVSNKIIDITEQYPTKNILVAYNSVINIRQIINSLENKIRAGITISILCSESSYREAGGYFNRLDKKNKLPCQINFMTSTYFTGIDIEDSYHLITVCDSRKVYSALTISKIIQIHGRCRIANGILSDTIIYNNTGKLIKNSETYKDILKSKADKVINLLEAADRLKQGDADLTDLFDRINKAIIERATERLFEQQSFELTRETIDNKLEVSYFNIDALYEKMEAYCKYYSSKEGLYKHIKEKYPSTIFHDDSDMENDNDRLEAGEKSFKEEQREENKARLQQHIASVRDDLITISKHNNLNDNFLNEQIKYSKGEIHEYYNRIKTHYQYFDIEFLSLILADIALMNKKTYRNLNNALVFRAMEDNHPFKSQILQNFEIGNKYSSEQIADIINTIIKDQNFKTLLSHQRTLLNHFKSFVESTYTQGDYIVKGFKPKYNGIEIPEPLQRISKNDVAIKYFDF